MDNRTRRAAIAQETLQILDCGQYLNRHGETVTIAAALSAAIAGSVHYPAEELRRIAASAVSAPPCATAFKVANETTLAAARRLVEAGVPDVLCLNFASARNPGGGFLGGSEAQEENLAKSSGLYPCIQQMTAFYQANRQMRFCAYLDDMIYAPKVPVFRDDGYACLDRPYGVSIVTAPAVNHGAVARNEPERLAELEAIMLGRIEKLLALARRHGHRTLVLGAWGCGVFGNDPADMARWFAHHLKDDAAYGRAFEQVHFAVLDRRDDGTFAAFDRVFGARH